MKVRTRKLVVFGSGGESNMDYIINVSRSGRFVFEINRMSDENKDNIHKFVGELRDNYKPQNGYLISTYKVVNNKKSTS